MLPVRLTQRTERLNHTAFGQNQGRGKARFHVDIISSSYRYIENGNLWGAISSEPIVLRKKWSLKTSAIVCLAGINSQKVTGLYVIIDHKTLLKKRNNFLLLRNGCFHDQFSYASSNTTKKSLIDYHYNEDNRVVMLLHKLRCISHCGDIVLQK